MVTSACSLFYRLLVLAAIVAGLSSATLGQESPVTPSAVADTDSGGDGDSDTDADTSDGPPEPAQKVDVHAVTDDSHISERLTKILNASKWISDTKVRTEEGIVFLQGTAEEAKYSEWAAQVARNTQDVVAVVNNIEIDDDVNVERSLGHITASLDKLRRDFLKRLPLILAGVVVILLTWGLNYLALAVVRRAAKRSRLRNSLRDLFLQLTTFLVWISGIMIAAIVIFPGMTPAKLLTVLGLSSVAIGFAFKDIFENFFAGILILWRFPFDRGDFIECEDFMGKVEDITIRMSEIRQVDGQLVVVPNATLFKNPVRVLTNSDTRRITITCGVAYDEDVDQSREVIREAVNKCDTVNKDQPVQIFAKAFASSSVDFEVAWWAGSTPLAVRESRDEVVAQIKRDLDEAGIEIPFPYRTLTFKSDQDEQQFNDQVNPSAP